MNKKLAMFVLACALAWRGTVTAAPRSDEVGGDAIVRWSMTAPTYEARPAAVDLETRLRLDDPEGGGVLGPGREGLANLVGPAEEGSFLVRLGIEFLEADSDVNVRVIDANGSLKNELELSSNGPARWSGNLCEVSAAKGRAGRLEISVKAGRVIATAYRGGDRYVTTIPVLSREAVAKSRGTGAFSTSGFRLPGIVPLEVSARTALSTGQSYYYGNYNWPGTNFVFNVYGGPANTCGELHTYRNGTDVVSWSCWMYTDGSGWGQNGPWYITTSYPGQNQTDDPSYIRWPDGSTTTSTWHIIDTIHPSVSIASNCNFCGTAAAAQWGSGFNSAWTTVLVAFRDDTSGLYWDDSFPNCGLNCYVSGPHWYTAATDAPASGRSFQLNWHYYPYIVCPVNHYCSVVAKVADQWGEGTVQTRQWYP